MLSIIPMSNRANKTIQRRILLGTLICAILLILGYLVFVGAPWGHQFDDYAYLGRGALSRKVVKLDSDILDLVSKSGAGHCGNGPDSSSQPCAAVLLSVQSRWRHLDAR